MMNGNSIFKRLAERAPDLVVLSLLVWVFLSHIERLDEARVKSLSDIGRTCHLVQDRATEALNELRQTISEVRDVMIEVKFLLAQR